MADPTTTGPSWTEIATAVSTFALAVAAIWAGIIARNQVRFWDAIERRKATFALIRDYVAPIHMKNHSAHTEVVLSPMQAYGNLVAGPDYSWTPPTPGEPLTIRDRLGEYATNYYVLRNYLDEAHDLYRRKIIDADLFLSRAGNLIAHATETLRRARELVPGAQQDNELFDSLEEMVRAFNDSNKRRLFKLS